MREREREREREGIGALAHVHVGMHVSYSWPGYMMLISRVEMVSNNCFGFDKLETNGAHGIISHLLALSVHVAVCYWSHLCTHHS